MWVTTHVEPKVSWIKLDFCARNASRRSVNIGRLGSIVETRSAKHWFPLCRLKWNRCLASALRALDPCFGSMPSRRALPLSFALLAMFRLVGESLFVVKLLFSRRKHEHCTTTDTQNIPVSKAHCPSNRAGLPVTCSPSEMKPEDALILAF